MPFQKIRSPRRTHALRTKLGRAELVKVLDQFAEAYMKPAFEDSVANWKTDVQFIKKKETGYKNIGVWVEAHKGKRIYAYVDKGTRPHVIRPKRAKRLAFQTGYNAKTAPIAQANVGDGSTSGDTVFAMSVNHPGTEARKFSEEINKRLKPDFKRAVDNMFKRLARQLQTQ